MKLARYTDGNGIHWGSVDTAAGTIRRIAGTFEAWAPEVTAKGPGVLQFEGKPTALKQVQLLPPIEPTAEIIGSGINYVTWALPPEGSDTCFEFKTLHCFAGPEGTLLWPQMIEAQPQCEFRYELELGLVIGSPIEEPTSQGTRHVLGYTVVNDGCLRHQRPSHIAFDWTGSKCGFHSSSIGPWIVTRDEFGDGQPDLALITRVNGVVTQDGRTSAMNWSIDRLLYELSFRLGFKAGDILFTGTPGYKGIPDGYIEPGDVIEFEIERIGVLKNYVEKEPQVLSRTGRAGKTRKSDPASIAQEIAALVAQVREWNGESAHALKSILDTLVELDEANAHDWIQPVRASLGAINSSLWPAYQSTDFDWWAVDIAYMRLYTRPGKLVFKAVGFTPDRVGGTP